MKQIFIDVETTGLSPETSGLVQVAGAIVIDDKLQESFNYFMRPPSDKACDKRALEVTGMTIEKIKSFAPSSDIFNQFKKTLLKYVDPYDKTDKLYFLAYNSPFDTQFIRQWFLDNGEKYFGSMFWTPDICVMRMAAQAVKEFRHKFINFKLATVCKKLQIESKGNLHDALVDIELTMELYKKLDSNVQLEVKD